MRPGLFLVPLLLAAQSWAYQLDFFRKEERLGRSRDFRMEKILLNVDLDVRGGKIGGISQLTFSPIRPDSRRIEIDAVELTIVAVELNGKKVEFERTPEKINLTIPDSELGKNAEVAIHYHGSPRRGLYFVQPDPSYPKKPYQAWSQGEDEDNRYWFPVYDYPNEKAQVEVIVRVDSDFTAVSNGALVSSKSNGKKKEFHFNLATPQASYLVSVAAGQFDRMEEKGSQTLLQYFGSPGTRSLFKDVFGRTDAFISFMAEVAGKKYPYEKYAQVVVEDFMYGGMENASATTLNRNLLYPKKDQADWKVYVDSIIAHEIAHQWFGDLITSERWNDIWLNEGFAEYLSLWALERTESPSEFPYQLELASSKLWENKVNEPTVPDRLNAPAVPHEALYERGAWILHMLRMKMGDSLFRQVIQTYVEAFSGKTAVTSDFQRVAEQVSGLSLTRFFEHWVYRGGYLRLKGGYKWDGLNRLVQIHLEQEPISNEKSVYYDADVLVEILTANGKVQKTVFLSDHEVNLKVALTEKPLGVRIDPERRWLRKLEFERTEEELISDASDSKLPFWVRLDAIQGLKEKRSERAARALAEVLKKEIFYGLRSESARSLGEIGTRASYDALIENLSEKNPQVRKEIVFQLRHDSRPSTIRRIRDVAEHDSSALVIAEAGFVLASKYPSENIGLLRKLAGRPAQRDVIAYRIFKGIDESGSSDLLPLLYDYARYGAPQRSRAPALEAIGKVGSFLSDKRKPLHELQKYVDDPWFLARASAYKGLGILGDPAAETFLMRAVKTEISERAKSAAEAGLSALRKAKGDGEAVQELKKELEELKSDQKEMKRKIEDLEKRRSGEKP
jgi:aminopeptidase N